MNNEQISNRIKARCKQRQLTVAQMLSDCDITRSFIYDLEKRGTSPSCDKISRIADCLDCSVDYLLGRTDDPELHKTEDKMGNLIVITTYCPISKATVEIKVLRAKNANGKIVQYFNGCDNSNGSSDCQQCINRNCFAVPDDGSLL